MTTIRIRIAAATIQPHGVSLCPLVTVVVAVACRTAVVPVAPDVGGADVVSVVSVVTVVVSVGGGVGWDEVVRVVVGRLGSEPGSELGSEPGTELGNVPPPPPPLPPQPPATAAQTMTASASPVRLRRRWCAIG
jgi:hypothetical protein